VKPAIPNVKLESSDTQPEVNTKEDNAIVITEDYETGVGTEGYICVGNTPDGDGNTWYIDDDDDCQDIVPTHQPVSRRSNSLNQTGWERNRKFVPFKQEVSNFTGPIEMEYDDEEDRQSGDAYPNNEEGEWHEGDRSVTNDSLHAGDQSGEFEEVKYGGGGSLLPVRGQQMVSKQVIYIYYIYILYIYIYIYI